MNRRVNNDVTEVQMAWMSQAKGRTMKKAKNTITTRAAFIAGLVMLLCCVASAGPTYSFVKIAGEWSFYEESDGLSSSFEVAPADPGLSGSAASSAADEDSDMSLPAVGSIVSLSSADGGSGGAAALLVPSGGGSSGGGVNSSGAPAGSGANGDVRIASDAYPGTSTYLLQTTLDNGFEDPDLDSGPRRGGLSNGTPDTTDPWEYWDNNDNQDIASPVPVPVPGSIILAAIGAGLVKLLHDRRLKR